MFLHVERALVLWNLVLCFSTCGTRSGIVSFHVIFICVCNVLSYCGIARYIFLSVERTLVLWNFVLYFSACGTRSSIVEFRVTYFLCGTYSTIVEFCATFFHILKVLVKIIQLLFVHVCCVFCCIFLCYIFRVVLKSLHFLKQLLLLFVWNFLVRL